MDDAEFGVRRSLDSPRSRNAESTTGKVIEPNDTGRSNGSVVAALRDRYARGVSTKFLSHDHALILIIM